MESKIKRKIVWNENGGIGFNLLLIIVIGLIAFQFIAPYINMKSFSDYYADYNSDEIENLTYVYELMETVTTSPVSHSTKTFDDDNSDYKGAVDYYNLDKATSYSIKITTNIPFAISNTYRVRIITKEIKQYEDIDIYLNSHWGIEYITGDNLIYESTGKLTTNDYIYNMGSEIRLNDGILYIYGNIYTMVVLSPNNEILYLEDFVIRMDD